MNNSGHFRILLADDDPDDRELFAEAAESHNAVVESVPNGMQLMNTLTRAQHLPNFIMLDLNMPEKGGKECLQEIRQHNRFDDVPVIIYSTSSSKKDIDDTFAMGANLYITKPNSFSELKATIKNILEMDLSGKQNAERDSFVYLR
jgi:DNA-binding response OmpR family regulator